MIKLDLNDIIRPEFLNEVLGRHYPDESSLVKVCQVKTPDLKEIVDYLVASKTTNTYIGVGGQTIGLKIIELKKYTSNVFDVYVEPKQGSLVLIPYE